MRILNSDTCDIPKAFDGLLSGELNVAPLIDELVPLERVKYAFDQQASGKAMKVLVKMSE